MKLIIALFFITITGFASEKVIYGEDNRENPADASPLMREVALSTAAMIQPVYIHSTGEEATISATTLAGRGICQDARFAQQITAAVCSGFLVGPDLLVTAGHCITHKEDCKKYQWVFDYADNSRGEKAITIPSSSIYSCKKILKSI